MAGVIRQRMSRNSNGLGMKRSSSLLAADDEIIIQGWVVRDGTGKGASPCRRYFALTSKKLLSAHDDRLERVQKTYGLHRGCILTEVHMHHFALTDETPLPLLGVYRRMTAMKTALVRLASPTHPPHTSRSSICSPVGLCLTYRCMPALNTAAHLSSPATGLS